MHLSFTLILFVMVAVSYSEIHQLELQDGDVINGIRSTEIVRVRRSPDGFDTDTKTKGTLMLGKFPDQDPNVKGVNKDKGISGILIGLLRQLLQVWLNSLKNFE